MVKAIQELSDNLKLENVTLKAEIENIKEPLRSMEAKK